MSDLPILFSAPMVRAILSEIEQPGTGKTQTRRALNPQPFADGYYEGEVDCTLVSAQASNLSAFFRFGAAAVGGGAIRTEAWTPRYDVGDRLYVREAHYRFGHWAPVEGVRTKTGRQKWQFVEDRDDVLFDAPEIFRKGMHHKDPATPAWHVRQGRTMFRHHSRITLIVTDVRVQRLQDISREDAMAEGVVQTWGDFMGDPPEWAVASINRHGDASGSHIYDNRTSVQNFRELWNHINAARGYGWNSNPWVAAYTFRPILGNIDQISNPSFNPET